MKKKQLNIYVTEDTQVKLNILIAVWNKKLREEAKANTMNKSTAIETMICSFYQALIDE